MPFHDPSPPNAKPSTYIINIDFPPTTPPPYTQDVCPLADPSACTATIRSPSIHPDNSGCLGVTIPTPLPLPSEKLPNIPTPPQSLGHLYLKAFTAFLFNAGPESIFLLLVTYDSFQTLSSTPDDF